MSKQIDLLSFRVEPELKTLYDDLPAESRRRVKVALYEAILKEHHLAQFDLKEYALKFGISRVEGEEGL